MTKDYHKYFTKLRVILQIISLNTQTMSYNPATYGKVKSVIAGY